MVYTAKGNQFRLAYVCAFMGFVEKNHLVSILCCILSDILCQAGSRRLLIPIIHCKCTF